MLWLLLVVVVLVGVVSVVLGLMLVFIVSDVRCKLQTMQFSLKGIGKTTKMLLSDAVLILTGTIEADVALLSNWPC